MPFGGVFVQVNHGEFGVQVEVEQFSDPLDELQVVLGVDGDVVTGVVPDKGVT